MEEPVRPAVVDLSGIDLASPALRDGSVLGHALDRIHQERDEGGPAYASFINEPRGLAWERGGAAKRGEAADPGEAAERGEGPA